jgi:hypothetical protein
MLGNLDLHDPHPGRALACSTGRQSRYHVPEVVCAFDGAPFYWQGC